MAPWKLPLIVAAIAVPVVAAFAIGGAGVGVAVGALTAVGVLVVAARQRPEEAIVPPAPGDGRRHVLLVATCAVEEPATVREIVRAAQIDGSEEEADFLVLAPAQIGFLDRWASDVERARDVAQRKLVATVAALAKAGVAAEARVGDEKVVQAVEDQLHSFPATDVVLVSGPAEDGDADAAAAADLEARLQQAEFHHIALSSRGR
jgi:hypothetical protein